jgi:integrase
MLCLAAEKLPEGPAWQYEVKLDGYSAIGVRTKAGVELWSQNKRDFSRRFPNVARALEALPADSVLDGEIVAVKATGAHLSAAHRLHEKSKPSTVNYELAVLRRGFKLAKRAGKVASCPGVPMLHVDNARKGFFERDQYDDMLRNLPEFLRPVAAVAYITGWRTMSELLTRQWRHVDFANGWLRLDPGETKSGEARNFPFTPELRTILEGQRELVRQIEKAEGVIIPWVFIHPPGTARCEAASRIKNFRGAWAKACKAAGVPGRLVHDFRRTAVRNLERAGVSRSAAMKLTGHKTEAVYRRYAIVDSTMLREAVDKLGALHAAEANYRISIRVSPVSSRN